MTPKYLQVAPCEGEAKANGRSEVKGKEALLPEEGGGEGGTDDSVSLESGYRQHSQHACRE